MKEIYINGRFLTHPLTGIGRFAYEICIELNKLVPITLIVPRKAIQPAFDVSIFKIREYGYSNGHLWEQLVLPTYFFRKKNYILLNFSGLGPILVRNKVTTVHDVSFLYNPQWFSAAYRIFYKCMTPISMKTSRRVLTVSEFAKADILRYYPFQRAEKLDVIYNAVRLNTKSNNQESKRKENYILTVGSLDPRKNLPLLIEAMQHPQLKAFELHLIGGTSKVFGDVGIDVESATNVRFMGHVSDETLSEEYANARLFVMPSLYEGFGIPPLESLRHGCPILISDIPVFHEIFEDSATYFDPHSASDLANKILDCLNNPCTIKDETIDRILGKFSWQKSANKLYNILQKEIL